MRRRIGYLPENPTFYDNVSAEELLAYFAALFGYRGAERARRVASLLDEVGLGAERRMQLRKYSKGMIQRVGLAQALINDPEVVFLDEPMSGLDPIGRRDVRDIILRLRDRGATVFFSSHILADAEAMCSRVGIVAGGKLVAAGALAEMVPFRIRGWDLVLAGVTADARGGAVGARCDGDLDRRRPVSRRPAVDGVVRRGDRVGHVRRGRAGVDQPGSRHARGFLPRPRAADAGPVLRLMRTIGLVALHVFRDSVRDKVLYSIVAFAVVLMAVSYLIGQLTAGEDLKIIKDLGLAAMSLMGLFIAVFIGIGLIAREIDRRSIYAILAKPVRRPELILGKYLGLVGTLFVNLAVMAVAYYLVLAYIGSTMSEAALRAAPAPPTDPRLLLAVAMIGLELALVTALALFWSTFSSSALLSAGLTIGLYVAGQFGADLKNFEQVVESPAAGLVGRALYYLLPNFAAFDIKTEVVHALPIEPGYLALTAGYAVVYIALLLTASVLIFSRRDFK